MYKYKPLKPRKMLNFPNTRYSKPVISPSEKKEYESVLFPSHPEILKECEEDPFLGEQARKAKARMQSLENPDRKTILREVKKTRAGFTKALIRKYPKDKLKIEQLQKKIEKDFDIRFRLQELLEIGSERSYTRKEERELETLWEASNRIRF